MNMLKNFFQNQDNRILVIGVLAILVVLFFRT